MISNKFINNENKNILKYKLLNANFLASNTPLLRYRGNNKRNQRSIDSTISYGHAAAENSEEIYLCIEMMRAYKSANVSHGDRQKDGLFVVNWQDNPDLENLPWQTYYDPTAFRITYFEQEQYVLQATLTGQGVGLLSDILCSASINQQWLLPIPSMPAFPGYSYSLGTSVHARNNRFVHIVRDWLVTKLSQPEKQC